VVVVDIFAVRDEPPQLLACEGKSGNNLEVEQARRYGSLQTDDVRRQTRVPNGPVRVVYACFQESRDRIRMGLDAAGIGASLILLGADEARLEPTVGAEDLAFNVKVPLGSPPRFIPVDPESPDEEYREILIPEIVAAASQSVEHVTVRTLVERAVPMWTHFAGAQVGRPRDQAARRIHGRAVDVLTALAGTSEFRDYFEIEPAGRDIVDAVVHIIKSPAGYAAQGETQGWQAIQRRAERSLRGRVRKVPPGQLSFEDLAREEQVGTEE